MAYLFYAASLLGTRFCAPGAWMNRVKSIRLCVSGCSAVHRASGTGRLTMASLCFAVFYWPVTAALIQIGWLNPSHRSR